MTEPGPPQDRAAEEAVIACALLYENALPEILESGGLDRSDFLSPRCGEAWVAAVALYGREEKIDQLTVAAEMGKRRPGHDDTFFRDLLRMTHEVPTRDHLGSYLAIVRAKARYRRLISLGAAVVQDAHEEKPIERIVAEAQTGFASLDRDGGGFRSLAEVLVDASFDTWEEDPAGIRDALPTGIGELDRVTGGLRRREQTIVAARTGEGKTALALALATNVARHGRVGFVSLEMDALSLGKRVVCALAGLDPVAIRARGWWPGELDRYREARRHAAHLGIHVDDATGLTTPVIRGRAQRLRAEHPDLALLIVDYAGLVMDDDGRDEAETRRLGRISLALRTLGRDLDLAVLTVAQLNRKPTERAGGKPSLADIRDSDKLAQDSGAVWLLYQPTREEALDGRKVEVRIPDKLNLYVAKNRYGPADVDLDLRFDRRLGRITAWERE